MSLGVYAPSFLHIFFAFRPSTVLSLSSLMLDHIFWSVSPRLLRFLYCLFLLPPLYPPSNLFANPPHLFFLFSTFFFLSPHYLSSLCCSYLLFISTVNNQHSNAHIILPWLSWRFISYISSSNLNLPHTFYGQWGGAKRMLEVNSCRYFGAATCRLHRNFQKVPN